MPKIGTLPSKLQEFLRVKVAPTADAVDIKIVDEQVLNRDNDGQLSFYVSGTKFSGTVLVKANDEVILFKKVGDNQFRNNTTLIGKVSLY